MDKAILYIHGQGGSAEEAEHYKPLFPNADVIGFDYTSQTPWQAHEEFPELFCALCADHKTVDIIANSIGAYFAMSALKDQKIGRAYFISPIVDMVKLIEDMMTWANVTKEELREKGTIETSFGQSLSWEYYSYAKNHPIIWNVPTHILYGGRDNLTSFETVSAFSSSIGAALTVMENGEHWFHTDGQMRFLDDWIKSSADQRGNYV